MKKFLSKQIFKSLKNVHTLIKEFPKIDAKPVEDEEIIKEFETYKFAKKIGKFNTKNNYRIGSFRRFR